MGPLGGLEAFAGLALLFFLPGFTVARAVFPERRLRGPAGLRGAVELVVLSFVLSVGLTVLVGYLLLSASPGGFSASWGSPVLEATLAALVVVALAVGLVRGSYARVPPPSPVPEAPGEEGAFELTRELDRLRAEKVRLMARRRSVADRPQEAEALRREIARLAGEEESLARRREADFEL